MTKPASKSAKRADDSARAAWLEKWMAAASHEGAMSQRKASAIEEKGGGLTAAAEVAKAAGIHLVLLTDDKGVERVAASRHPFKILA